jgi:hypothetical protein
VGVGCLVISIAGLARQPGVLLPTPDVPEIHLTFQRPAEPLDHTRGPLLRAVVSNRSSALSNFSSCVPALSNAFSRSVAVRMP